MTCPAGCVREKDHEGFHTTHPEIAQREDRAEYDRFIDLGPVPSEIAQPGKSRAKWPEGFEA